MYLDDGSAAYKAEIVLSDLKHIIKEGEKKWFQVEWQTDSRVGSRKNIQHKAGGGDIKVFIMVMM